MQRHTAIRVADLMHEEKLKQRIGQIVAERNKLDLADTKVHVVKEMIQQPVRRIGALRVTVTVPNGGV